MKKWPFYLLGGAGLVGGIFALTKWFVAQDEWAGGVTEPEGLFEEESAVSTNALLSWPLAGRVSSPYGPRIHPITGTTSFHNGIDIAVPAGTVVRAPADGIVRRVWEDLDYGGGYSLLLAHDGELAGYATGFAHLSKWLVTTGARVKRGEPIALSGGVRGQPGAGASTGAHLHLTVRRSGVTVDPVGELEPQTDNPPNIA